MRRMKDSGIEWIGEIPEEWDTRRIKYLPDPKIKNSFIDGDWIESPQISESGIRYLTTGNIGDGVFKVQGNGFITEEVFQKLNCKYAYPGDLIISRLNAPYGRSCILPDLFDKYVLAVDNVILRTKENRGYLCYVTQCEGYQSAVKDESKGTTMKRISRTNLGKIIVPLPSYDIQCRISDYLDRKCAEIDAVIARQEAVIEKLKEYKLSLITEAVTRGLNPDAPMKDSGIEWIGQIPEHWKCSRLKYLISYIESGVSVNAGQNEATGDELGVLKTSSVSKFYFDVHENKSVNHEEETRVACPVIANTIIVSRMNTPELVGACGYVDKSYENIFLPDRLWQVHFNEDVNVKFIYYFLLSKNIRNYYSSLSTGTSSSMQNISQGQFTHAFVFLPPIEEQVKIACCLDNKCSAIEATVAQKKFLIDHLASYKKSLIYEAVTGKREVPA